MYEELHLIHQNIQCISGKILEIELFLEKIQTIDLLCLTEHWLKNYQMLFGFQNYNVISSFSRKNTTQGGSLILIRNNLKSKERIDIVKLSIECIIELSCVELEKHIIVCVYRPPIDSNFSTFESVMEDVLNLALKSNKFIIVCGDFNVNLLENNSYTIRILSLFKSFNLANVFLEPTRITETTATCIDNVFCNCCLLDSAMINCLRSDHCGQSVKFPILKNNRAVEILTRPVTVKRVEKYIEVLVNILPLSNFDLTDTNDSYGNLFKVIYNEFNKIFKQKKININSKYMFSAWATTGIRKSRERLFDLYDKRTYTHDTVFNEYVKKYSKIFKKVCIIAKSKYISNKIKISDNKMKTVWKIINNETGNVKPRDKEYNIKSSDGLISTDKEVAQLFEAFFTDVPTKITETLHSSPVLAEILLKSNVDRCDTRFSFRHTDPQEIIKTFKLLKLKNTEDLWGMSVKLSRTFIHILAPHLAFIFNKSVNQGIFPDLMKNSKLIPLFKSGCKQDASNYRPISVLPVLGKIFEKILLKQLICHFNTKGLLHKHQFGFTKGRSTLDAGVELIRHIFDAWEDSHDAIGVFCDLSKAFDCVDHKTLLLKLNHYGVNDRALDLLQSYLVGRVQTVQINEERSGGSVIEMGVPQGSILGPFLFLVYINDLPHLVREMCDMVLFADDTSLIFKMDRKVHEPQAINNTLKEVLNWFTVNNLVLNNKKTKCIKFKLHNVKKDESNIILNNSSLEFVADTVFLGITIDSTLQWGPHISALAGRLSSAAYAIKKIRRLTDVGTARLVYFSYFHSIMSYGILLWGRAADIETVFVLQKRAIRAIYDLRCRESLRELFKEIGILTVAGQYIYENIMYVRKNLSLFLRGCDRHTYNTRNKNKLAMQRFRLSKVSTSFMGHCIRFYNKLPDEKLNMTEKQFKNYIKQTLCKKAYYKVCDYLNDKDPWC